MEKRREQGGVLGSVAELFDLPADVVAAEAGVPGVWMRIAEMEPPKIAPQ